MRGIRQNHSPYKPLDYHELFPEFFLKFVLSVHTKIGNCQIGSQLLNSKKVVLIACM